MGRRKLHRETLQSIPGTTAAFPHIDCRGNVKEIARDQLAGEVIGISFSYFYTHSRFLIKRKKFWYITLRRNE